MKFNIRANGYTQHERLLKERLSERLSADYAADGLVIELALDASLGAPESYQIKKTEGGFLILGSDEMGLYYGVGKFLHSAKWEEDALTPTVTDGVVTPACSYRCIYFPLHFYNWYQVAPAEEVGHYLEDLLLWGYNTVHTTLPLVNSENAEDEVFKTGIQNARRLFSLAKKLGIKTSLSVGINQGFKGAPHEYDAEISYNTYLRGSYGRNLCPSNPEALAYLRGTWRSKMEPFLDIGLDYVTCWPYDEGGCGCADCRPWGARGYGKICLATREEAKKLYPNVKVVVSTWTFDIVEDEGEYAGLYKRLDGGDLDWVDYLLVDAHGAYPRYPLEHTPIKPIVNFPEISMWGLYPWGGFGATPLPERFQGFWDSSKKILSGGMPYSEGIYEDISKIQCLGYYWNPDKHYSEILSEYINYEYGYDVIDDALTLMRLIEVNEVFTANENPPEYDKAEQALALAHSINARLSDRAKNAWRWRILYIRAMLDAKRYKGYLALSDSEEDQKIKKYFRAYSDMVVRDDEEAQDLFRELIKIYHCVPNNGENRWTLPPLGGAAGYPANP